MSFTGGGVWTVVAVTGGHVQSVERFAIQGVHTEIWTAELLDG